jgi:putative DNA primase/helicase
MRFEDFARIHGLIIDHVVPHRQMRTPTEDHPRSKNGSYKFLGNIGFVMNWATMEEPAVWFPDKKTASSSVIAKPLIDHDKERERLAKKASDKAGWILHQCKEETHPYLASKGFPNEVGNVWTKGDERILVIPMRIDKRLVGCQLINDKGVKKFLYGQTTKGATFTMNAKGFPILCEGYATALSVREAMIANNIKYSIYVCFSASNMKFVARQFPYGLIVADNDNSHVGETSARKTGKPYWLSETIGEDFNDFHKRVGTFKASQSLKKKLIEIGSLVI